jgi:phage FluMu gp28-like protein
MTQINKQLGTRFIEKNAHKNIFNFASGGFIQIKSGDDPDSLRGETLDYLILDEAAYHSPEIWKVLRYTLMVNNGEALFLSTPCGQNWFYELYMRGKDKTKANWASWQLPSTVSQFISKEEIEDAKTDALCDYEVEIMAEFKSSGYQIFHSVKKCINNEHKPKPEKDHDYIFGIDFGRDKDFTVISILDISKDFPELVHIERFNKMNWTKQREQIVSLAESFKPIKIIAESNSFGSVNIEELQKEIDCEIHSFNTSNKSKKEIIEFLANAFDRGSISIFNDKQLIHELALFQGYFKNDIYYYSAPSGVHDDCVMSLAIAYSYFLKPLYNLTMDYTMNRNLIGI